MRRGKLTVFPDALRQKGANQFNHAVYKHGLLTEGGLGSAWVYKLALLRWWYSARK